MFPLDASCSMWPAARVGCAVGGTGWSARHRRRHCAEPGAACTGARRRGRLKASFIEGDAEALPFEDASFDVVTNLVGAMFAPQPELVDHKLL